MTVVKNMQKNIKLKNFWPKLWQMIEPSQKQLKVALVWIVVVEITKLGGPYLLKLIIDNLTRVDKFNLGLIIVLAVCLFLAEQVNSLFENVKDRRIFRIIADIEKYLPIKAMEKLLALGLAFHERANTGKKVYKIQNGIGKLTDLLGNLYWEVLPVMLQLMITIIMLFWVDWRLSLSVVFFAPIFLWLTYRANLVIYPMRRERYDKYEEAGGRMAQSIININTVKSFVQEDREMAEYAELEKSIAKNNIIEYVKLSNSALLRSLVVDSGRLLILLIGSYLAYNGQMTVGSLVFVITLSEKAYSSLFRLSRFYDRLQSAMIAVGRLGEIFDEDLDIENIKDGLQPKKIEGRFEFKDVSYKYSEESDYVLKDVNVKIGSGSITALVGPSGGGKTTLVRMLYRHYDPQVGSVKLDGKDLRDYDLFAMRRFMAIVPQEVEIFDGSIKDNIAYTNPEASMEEIEAAARIANVEEFVKKLPEKYETEVGERGIKLSGGQRQRVGIARAILANPRILIFDEATSSLDSMSERLIQESMDKISRGRTTIIIAHRLSTIRKADKIIVIENGEIREEGNHLELSRNKGGLYAKLLELQKIGEIE